MKNASARLILLSTICLAIGSIWTPLQAGTPADPDSLTDGPHVYWADDTTAVVFYWCGDEKISFPVTVRDTAVFTGACRDRASTYFIRRAPLPPGPSVTDPASRILAVSDIHGEFAAFVHLLRVAGVMSADGAWTWGDGHLVIVGDVFDRGAQVTECLWLIRRLEREAALAGGAVHMLLGNHEVIALQGDLRYVHPRYLGGIVRKFRIPYDDLFGPDMELGRWLRSKPTMLRAGRTLYVHADLSPQLVDRDLDIEAVNRGVREAIDMTGPAVTFGDLPQLLLGSYGPLWYRGFHQALGARYERLTDAEVDRVLKHFDVDYVVVGHSEQRQIQSDYDARIFSIDVPVDGPGELEALLWEQGQFYRIRGDGERLPLR